MVARVSRPVAQPREGVLGGHLGEIPRIYRRIRRTPCTPPRTSGLTARTNLEHRVRDRHHDHDRQQWP
jgi:hypothetical protein